MDAPVGKPDAGHGKEEIKCDRCGTTFKRLSYLTKHNLNIHMIYRATHIGTFDIKSTSVSGSRSTEYRDIYFPSSTSTDNSQTEQLPPLQFLLKAYPMHGSPSLRQKDPVHRIYEKPEKPTHDNETYNYIASGNPSPPMSASSPKDSTGSPQIDLQMSPMVKEPVGSNVSYAPVDSSYNMSDETNHTAHLAVTAVTAVSTTYLKRDATPTYVVLPLPKTKEQQEMGTRETNVNDPNQQNESSFLSGLPCLALSRK